VARAGVASQLREGGSIALEGRGIICVDCTLSTNLIKNKNKHPQVTQSVAISEEKNKPLTDSLVLYPVLLNIVF
jgi:hypothetical protein